MIKATKELIMEFVDNNCHNCKVYPICGAAIARCHYWDKFVKFIEDKNKEYGSKIH